MKMNPLRLVRLLPLFAAAFAGAQAGISNPGFETGTAGQAPPAWIVPFLVNQAGYTIEVSDQGAKEGKQYLSVALGTRQGQGVGNVFQEIDATPFRGKRIKYRAAVRYDRGSEVGQVQLWLRIDRANGEQGFFDNMANRPITSSTWAFYEIVASVPTDAVKISVGMMLVGGGRASLDAASLTAADANDLPIVKPRALQGRELENLVAFTKLLGYVRHFHPSDAVESADWNGFAMAGVTAAEGAQNATDLAAKLQAFFQPLAPTVRVFATGKAPSEPIKFGTGSQVVAWEHIGFGGGTIPEGQNVYRSRRAFAAGTMIDPKTIIQADLGGGVSCEVPSVLFAAHNSALPKTTDPIVPKGTRSTPTGNDRTTRLAAVALGWNVFEHFYPYFEEVNTDWPGVLSASLTSAATDADAMAFLGTLRRMVGAAQDGHGHVMYPEDDRYASPPVLVDWVEGKLVVTQVGAGIASPRPGDEVLQIDDKPVEALWKEKEAEISGATPQWRRARGRDSLLLGPAGSTLVLQVRPKGGNPTFASLKRTMGGAPQEKRPKVMEEIKVGIWYVNLDGSQGVLMEDYKKSLRELTSAEGVIFDMRGYPGDVAMDVLRRLAKEPITSAHWNVPKVTKPDHVGMEFLKSRWSPAAPEVPRFRARWPLSPTAGRSATRRA